MAVRQLICPRCSSQTSILRGGVAPARAYIPELLSDVLAEKIDPSLDLDVTVDLNGYQSHGKSLAIAAFKVIPKNKFSPLLRITGFSGGVTASYINFVMAQV